jgi:alpha-N-acetylglucosamine transferase
LIELIDSSATWADSYTKLLAFNQTQYDRVLSLDSDSTVLQPMDELFLMPSAPVAMPRAYWLTEESTLSSQIVLIQPTEQEFTRIKNAIDTAKGGEFDMEIVNQLYGKDCMILPHRRYDLLTGEFRKPEPKEHVPYIGNDYEMWDPEKMLKEAKFLHFSDWPVPKPWLSTPASVLNNHQPKCIKGKDGKEDCRSRDIWLGFYSDFKERRRVCFPFPLNYYYLFLTPSRTSAESTLESDPKRSKRSDRADATSTFPSNEFSGHDHAQGLDFTSRACKHNSINTTRE